MTKLRNGKILMDDVPWLVVQKLMEILLHINVSIGVVIKCPLTKFKLDIPHTSYAQNLLLRFAKKVLKDFFNGKITLKHFMEENALIRNVLTAEYWEQRLYNSIVNYMIVMVVLPQ